MGSYERVGMINDRKSTLLKKSNELGYTAIVDAICCFRRYLKQCYDAAEQVPAAAKQYRAHAGVQSRLFKKLNF